MSVYYSYHVNDIAPRTALSGDLAIDTETMGINRYGDRLCLIQISDSLGNIHLVHFKKNNYHAPNLKNLLLDESRQKIFHFARFDVCIILKYLNISLQNIFCTKIASRMSRTYASYHGLSELCMELLGVKLSKQEQRSDWGSDNLTKEQLEYAARDVLYLHKLKEKLEHLLHREEVADIAHGCFKFLPTRARLDLIGWGEIDIFAHR